MKLQFKDCKEALEFYIYYREDPAACDSTTESYLKSQIEGSMAYSTNQDSLIGIDDIINALVDIERILSKFPVLIQRAFLEYGLGGRRRAHAILASTWKGRLLSSDRRYKILSRMLKNLAAMLLKAHYLKPGYLAEGDDLEQLKAENEVPKLAQKIF